MNRRNFLTLISAVISTVRDTGKVSPDVPKVPRSQCKVCNGTGRVRAGDGSVVVTRECDNCYSDAPAEKPAEKRRIIVYSSDNCAPCRVLDQTIRQLHEKPEVRKSVPSHITMVPTTVIMVGGKEVKRKVGSMSPQQWHQFIESGRKTPAQLREWVKNNPQQSIALVRGQTYQQHMTDRQQHSGLAFEAWQLNGLTLSELQKLHGAQHTNTIQP